MSVKTEAIVLRCVRYGETRLLVDLYTREQGSLTVGVSAARTPRGQMQRQLFRPLTLLEVETLERGGGPQRLRHLRLLAPYADLNADPVRLSVALFTAEFLYHALRGEQQNRPLFDYVYRSLLWLDGSSAPVANFHLVLMMRLSRFLGFHPNLEGYAPGMWFDLRDSRFTPVRPQHADCLEPGEAAAIRLVMRMDFATMHRFRFSRAERNRCTDVLVAYYRLHLPAFPELCSLPVLRELWD